jgi:phosphatidylserine/phosphatidylglycerophosphate/cardiolipin synthase-like enzyme
VSVQVVSNSPSTNDLPEISLVGRGYYHRLLAVNDTPEVRACGEQPAGLRIWEWVGRSAHESVRHQGTMHSKYAVIDGARSLVGSYNLDPRSEKLNSETAVVFLHPHLSGELRRKFLAEDLRYASEVTPEQAAGFEAPESVVERYRKSLGSLFEEHL